MRALHSLLILVIACVPPNQGAAGPQPQQYQQQQGGATCEGACQHYLGCKGANDAGSWQSCLGECERRQVAPAELAEYQQTDCATAINIVEGGGNQGGQQGASQSSDCQGCVRDGDSCVWISQSNWGSGPYSGAVSSCASSCCGM